MFCTGTEPTYFMEFNEVKVETVHGNGAAGGC